MIRIFVCWLFLLQHFLLRMCCVRVWVCLLFGSSRMHIVLLVPIPFCNSTHFDKYCAVNSALILLTLVALVLLKLSKFFLHRTVHISNIQHWTWTLNISFYIYVWMLHISIWNLRNFVRQMLFVTHKYYIPIIAILLGCYYFWQYLLLLLFPLSTSIFICVFHQHYAEAFKAIWSVQYAKRFSFYLPFSSFHCEYLLLSI